MMKRILVVGAGFAGAVVARELAEDGYIVDVIDARDHIGGNSYDYEDKNGIRIHKYGPHICHTNNTAAFEWFSKFTEWVPYRHQVRALLDNGKYVPIPLNRNTINEVFNLNLQNNEEVEQFLDTVKIPHETINNSRELIEARFGEKLTNIFFAPYTKKMWGASLEDTAKSIAGRIPTVLDESGDYFPTEQHQCLPKDGYTAAFNRMFDHPNIKVSVSTVFEKSMERRYYHVFNSMPIDVYFDNCHGELPYRSIKFKTETLDCIKKFPVATVNFTDDGIYTRVTEWKNFPNHGSNDACTVITYEEPCDYRDNNMERYYPMRDAAGVYSGIHRKYQEEADKLPNVTFIGRCGLYAYFDMHMSISASLNTVKKFRLSEKA